MQVRIERFDVAQSSVLFRPTRPVFGAAGPSGDPKGRFGERSGPLTSDRLGGRSARRNTSS